MRSSPRRARTAARCGSRGDPGVGKTELLNAAATIASAAGTRILRAAGVEFEAEISFSGLNQVLLPLFDALPSAPGRPARRAERGARSSARECRPADSSYRMRPSCCFARQPRPDPCSLSSTTCPGWTERAPRCSASSHGASRQQDRPDRRVADGRGGILRSRSASRSSSSSRSATQRHGQLLDTRYPHLSSTVRDRILVDAAGQRARAPGAPGGARPGHPDVRQRPPVDTPARQTTAGVVPIADHGSAALGRGGSCCSWRSTARVTCGYSRRAPSRTPALAISPQQSRLAWRRWTRTPTGSSSATL